MGSSRLERSIRSRLVAPSRSPGSGRPADCSGVAPHNHQVEHNSPLDRDRAEGRASDGRANPGDSSATPARCRRPSSEGRVSIGSPIAVITLVQSTGWVL